MFQEPLNRLVVMRLVVMRLVVMRLVVMRLVVMRLVATVVIGASRSWRGESRLERTTLD